MEDQKKADLDAHLERLAVGDRSAFTYVFTCLQQPIFRLCMSMLDHEADARDATQQAMVKILERASDYDPTRPALPWACAIAAWECRTIRRRRARRRETTTGLRAHEDIGSTDGESEAVRRDLMHAAAHALGELTERDRETLLATLAEESVAVSAAGLRKRRQRALERLRSKFRRLYGLD
jgi:RNA polymerase sigma-70 factor (ECF subfamily)